MLHINFGQCWHQDPIPVELHCMSNDWNVWILVDEIDEQSCAIFAEPFGVHIFEPPLAKFMKLFSLLIDVFFGHEVKFEHIHTLAHLVSKNSEADWFRFPRVGCLEIEHVEVILLFRHLCFLFDSGLLELPI